MKALILAAGYATRLYPLTIEYPKPLLEVGDRPIINYILEKLERIDAVDEIFVVTNTKFIDRFRQWAKEIKSPKRISLIDDLTRDYHHRRGAIGDMIFAIRKKRINDDLLVIGGDNIFDGTLDEFLQFAREHKPHPLIGVFNIKKKEQARHYGVVELDKKNRIVAFQEKPEKPLSALVAMCLYYFPKRSLSFIKEYIETKVDKHDATGFYIDWLRQIESVYGFIFYGHWYDIGLPKIYKEANKTYVGT
jgi:glucose-1-phosphate thymidylyltransferase